MAKENKAVPLDDFRKASRTYSDMSILMHEAIARKAGLSGTDHKYLGFLMERGPMTAGELGTLTGLTSGAITGLVDRLEKKRLVKRQFDKEDRRKVFIVPDTEHTLKLFKPLFTPLVQKTEKVLSGFSSQEILVIQRYFEAAAEVMNELIHQYNNE